MLACRHSMYHHRWSDLARTLGKQRNLTLSLWMHTLDLGVLSPTSDWCCQMSAPVKLYKVKHGCHGFIARIFNLETTRLLWHKEYICMSPERVPKRILQCSFYMMGIFVFSSTLSHWTWVWPSADALWTDRSLTQKTTPILQRENNRRKPH